MPGTATVAFLFVDLVGSTDILSRLGDDASDEVRRRYIGELRGAVARTVGVEVKSLGDGMMVAFERSVADAVSCGIEMQRAIDGLRRADPLLRLQIRVGISVGEAAPEGRDWHGTPVVEAARLEAKARPGQILANDVIRHLLGNRGGFDCTPVGEYELKGFPEPLACCEVAWEPVPGLPEVPLPAALHQTAALAGREQEMERLAAAWARVRTGAGATVLITGEPGVGKTRLAADLANRAHGERASVLYGQCDADAALVDQPVAEALRWYAAACAPDVMREQLGGDGAVLMELVPSLAARVADLRAAPRVVAGRGELTAAVRAFLSRAATAQPVLLIVDDLHNAPASTRELLAEIAAAPPEHLMLVAISRRADVLSAGPGIDRISITGLSGAGVAALVRDHLGVIPDPPPVDVDALAATIVAETAGNPRHALDVLERVISAGGLEADPAAQQAAIRAAAAETCPYKGLLAYQSDDAGIFFGREEDVAALVSRLAGQRLLAVVGASGSGKSSVVRAGVLPALQRGALAGSEQWPAVVFTPGPHPLAELSASCAPVLGVSVGALLAQLESDPGGLAAAVSGSEWERLVVFVDQFEETFTLGDDVTERGRFVDALLGAAAAPGGPVLVVIAMRADFFGFAASVPGLAAALEASTSLLGPMDEDALRSAIEGPARIAGLKIEPGLAELMLRDVAGEPGSLPLLSHALLETWKRRADRTLTFAGYRECGGVRGAIARTAEAVYLGLDAGQQQLTRSVFVRLTELGEGTEDTRRRVALEELRPEVGASADLERLLRTLTDARLLTTGEHTVEVAHEALIREWPRLRAWLDDDREGIRTLRHLTDTAREWDQLGRDPGELYRGPRLVGALEWASGAPAALNPLERDFLDVSRERAEGEQREAERRTRRLRLLLAGTAVALVLALIGGGLAVRKTGEARDQTREADIQRLVGQSGSLVETKRDLAMLLAVEANRRNDRVDTRSAMQTALVHDPTFLGYLRLGTSNTQTAVFTPDGKRVLIGRVDGTITVADVATHQSVGAPIRASTKPVIQLRVTPDGKEVMAEDDDAKRISVFDLITGRKVRDLVPDQPIAVFAISPDGSRVAAGGYVDVPEQPKVFVWDAKTGQRIATLATDKSPQTLESNDGPNRSAVALSSTGLLAVGSEADTITLFDAKTLRSVGRLAGVPDVVGLRMAFSPDGERLVSTEPRTQKLMLWDVAARKPAWSAPIETAQSAVAVTADHDVVVSNLGGRVETFGAVDGHSVGSPISLQTGSVCDINTSFDARTLAVADCNEPTVALLSLDGRNTVGPIAAQNEGLGGYSPDGTLLWTGSERGITIRDARTFRVRYRVPDFPAAVFAADSKHFVVIGTDGKAGVYDYRTKTFVGKPITIPRPEAITANARDPITGNYALGYNDGVVVILDSKGRRVGPSNIKVGGFPNNSVSGLSFTPGGKRLAVAAQTEQTVVFDTRTRRPVGKPLVRAANARFSPDGGLLVVAGFDGTVTFYDGHTLGARGPAWTGSRAFAQSLEFSRDGRVLATAALDSSARLFDVVARQVMGAPFAVLQGTSAVLRPDGKALALEIPGDHPRTQVWDLDPAHWRAAACLEAGRNLTRAEWDLYIGGDYRETCPQWPAGS